jgi:hypothetical protein
MLSISVADNVIYYKAQRLALDSFISHRDMIF